MWTCSELKKNAWKNLSPNYWWAVLLVFLNMVIVSTVSSIVSGTASAFSSVFSTMITVLSPSISSHATFAEVMSIMAPMFIGISILSAVSIALSYAITIFLSNPLSCGMYRWFMIEHEQKSMHSVDALFTPFKKGTYTHLASGMAWKLLWTFVWGLIAAIPILIPTAVTIVLAVNADDSAFKVSEYFGITLSASWFGIILTLVILYIIASIISIMISLNRYYAYFYTHFILLDEPDIRFREALKKSIQMSHGQKGRMFILDLSFIGWWLLVSLTCGFFSVALAPYLYATYTELYFFRKDECNSNTASIGPDKAITSEMPV